MAITIIIISSICLCMGILILAGRGDFLISGYNRASEEEKAKYNVERLRLVTGVLMLAIAFLILAFMFKPGTAVSIVLSVFLAAVATAGVILMNTWAKNDDAEIDTVTSSLPRRNTHKKKNIYIWISLAITAAIIVACTFLVLRTLPKENVLEGQTLTVKFCIGKEVIDMTDAVFKPIPDEARHNLVRTFGTSLGDKNSGEFTNSKTGTKFYLYTTGKGEKKYFEIGDKKYLVDGI